MLGSVVLCHAGLSIWDRWVRIMADAPPLETRISLVILSPLSVCWHSDPFCTPIREGLGTCSRIPQSPYQRVAIHFCGWEAQAGGQKQQVPGFGVFAVAVAAVSRRQVLLGFFEAAKSSHAAVALQLAPCAPAALAPPNTWGISPSCF